jgi:hypothetical protein
LGIPFSDSELGAGRGNRIHYGFYHLVECGIAVFALNRGVRPKDLRPLLNDRKRLRQSYRKAFLAQPEGALDADWIKTRSSPLLRAEHYLRIHDRYSDAPGRVDMLRQDEMTDLSQLFTMVERYPGEKARTLVPLTRIILELVAWALLAPEMKPGP